MAGQPVRSDDLTRSLERELRRHLDRHIHIRRLVRRPHDYRSSFNVEEVEVHLSDTTILEVIFKDLSWSSLSDAARRAKPKFLHDEYREIEAYRDFLSPTRLGPKFIGAELELGPWLFIEKVDGAPLLETSKFSVWSDAARWVAQMHRRLASSISLASARHLIRYDAQYYRRWMERARTINRDLDKLADSYEKVVQRLVRLPPTLIHGEFYPSNILISEAETEVVVVPVDWELAAIGPGLMDLACLVAGRWTDEQRKELALAYFDEHSSNRVRQDFHTDLDFARLHLSVQWLGWSAEWSPPPELAHDWFADAMVLGEKLGVLR